MKKVNYNGHDFYPQHNVNPLAIGEEQTDENGRIFKMINGKKIYQMEIRNEHDRRISDAINLWRTRIK